MAEEAFDARGLVAALNAAADDDGSAKPLTINDVPNDVLVSIFMAVGDLRWVRHTIPLVCKAWNELFLSKDASPLHETLEVDFYEEVKKAVVVSATREEEEEKEKEWWRLPHHPVIHASRLISWAERRAGSLRKLRLEGWPWTSFRPLEDFSPEDLGALVRVVGSSLTEISLGRGVGMLCEEPFWESLRDYVVPAGRLRSFVVTGIQSHAFNSITEIPATISSLKKLEEFRLTHCRLFSLPKELGELSGLTMLDLTSNPTLGNPAFPAELGNMKSLRELRLIHCGLRAVPAFIGELESLEIFDLCYNSHLQIHAPLDILVEGCPRLRKVRLYKEVFWDPASRAHVEAFEAKLCAKNPGARVFY